MPTTNPKSRVLDKRISTNNEFTWSSRGNRTALLIIRGSYTQRTPPSRETVLPGLLLLLGIKDVRGSIILNQPIIYKHRKTNKIRADHAN